MVAMQVAGGDAGTSHDVEGTVSPPFGAAVTLVMLSVAERWNQHFLLELLVQSGREKDCIWGECVSEKGVSSVCVALLCTCESLVGRG